MERAVQSALWWTATLFILAVCLATCQPKPAYAIYACASPKEVYEEATSNGWIYVKIVDGHKFQSSRVELWTKNERFVEVYYRMSSDVDYSRECYAGETGHLPRLLKIPGFGHNPNPYGV